MMRQPLRVALAQLNTVVGDLEGNARRIESNVRRAVDLGADIIAFPELAITGYPPEDLLLKPGFLDDNMACLRSLASLSDDITIVVGFVDVAADIYNAAGVLAGGELAAVYRKHFLPTYSVFDEDRYFRRGTESVLLSAGHATVGITVCEDIWYPGGPMSEQTAAGAQIVVNISASPYRRGVVQSRDRMLATRAGDHGAVVCFVNLVGGQDELVFDGSSAVYGPDGRRLAAAPSFREELLLADIDPESVFRRRLQDPRSRKLASPAAPATTTFAVPMHDSASARRASIEADLSGGDADPCGELYSALRLALGDYARKSGFQKAVVGLSGGVDSSLVAVLAVDALGAQNVTGVSMPSRYSSEHSRSDAAALALNLGIQLLTIPIEAPFSGFLEALAPAFENREPDLTEENLQARCRGNILMALSNKFGWLVLATGNKSEMAVGYSTLYGDLAGGFALIKDVPKTTVYELCRYRNSISEVIPPSVLTKAPSAELRPGQVDQDTLPPYPVLDAILEQYVELDQGPDEIAASGFDEATVRKVIRMVDRSEYKRRQAPPGPKVSPRAFGRDRRLPIVNQYRHG